jgi:peroxiredoxin Q/BCP
MAQLRRDYQKFIDKESEVLVVGPDSQPAFEKYWSKHRLPFIGLPDPDHHAANIYRQQVKLLRFGRMPAIFVIDKSGRIRYQNYGDGMHDIPSNEEVLGLVDKLNQESGAVISDIEENG